MLGIENPKKGIHLVVGIENLKKGIHLVVGMICDGVVLAKSAKDIVAEAKDLSIDEGVSLVVTIATEEAPRIMAAIKA